MANNNIGYVIGGGLREFVLHDHQAEQQEGSSSSVIAGAGASLAW